MFEGIDPKADGIGNVDYRSVTPDYFRALEIPLVGGRGFTEFDRETALPVAIIDERLARLFGGADPIGLRAGVRSRLSMDVPSLCVAILPRFVSDLRTRGSRFGVFSGASSSGRIAWRSGSRARDWPRR